MAGKFKSEIIQKADVPFSFDEIQRIAIEKWGELSGKKKPSFFPEEKVFLNICAHEKMKNIKPNECSDFVINEETLFFPNVHGLVVAENLDLVHNFIPVNTTILGIDYIFYLFYDHKKAKDHLIPALEKKVDGNYEHHLLPFKKMLKGAKFLVYSKEEIAA